MQPVCFSDSLYFQMRQCHLLAENGTLRNPESFKNVIYNKYPTNLISSNKSFRHSVKVMHVLKTPHRINIMRIIDPVNIFVLTINESVCIVLQTYCEWFISQLHWRFQCLFQGFFFLKCLSILESFSFLLSLWQAFSQSKLFYKRTSSVISWVISYPSKHNAEFFTKYLWQQSSKLTWRW